MWKNNRPEEWKNPYQKAVDDAKVAGFGTTDEWIVAFEAGADAMLKKVVEWIYDMGSSPNDSIIVLRSEDVGDLLKEIE